MWGDYRLLIGISVQKFGRGGKKDRAKDLEKDGGEEERRSRGLKSEK